MHRAVAHLTRASTAWAWGLLLHAERAGEPGWVGFVQRHWGRLRKADGYGQLREHARRAGVAWYSHKQGEHGRCRQAVQAWRVSAAGSASLGSAMKAGDTVWACSALSRAALEWLRAAKEGGAMELAKARAVQAWSTKDSQKTLRWWSFDAKLQGVLKMWRQTSTQSSLNLWRVVAEGWVVESAAAHKAGEHNKKGHMRKELRVAMRRRLDVKPEAPSQRSLGPRALARAFRAWRSSAAHMGQRMSEEHAMDIMDFLAEESEREGLAVGSKAWEHNARRRMYSQWRAQVQAWGGAGHTTNGGLNRSCPAERADL